MNSRTRKPLIDVMIPGMLATAIILLLPKIYNSIEQPKLVTDTIGIKYSLAITAPGDTLFDYMTDKRYLQQ